jgi:hypothetical protein
VLPSAFAHNIPGIDQVEQMVFRVTYYTRFTSKDGQRTWIGKQQEERAFRAPGQLRETRFDENGNVRTIIISDKQLGQSLQLDVPEKKATLKQLNSASHVPESPFAYVGTVIREQKSEGEWIVRSVKLAGQQAFDGKDANVIRATLQSGINQSRQRHDYFFDVSTKAFLGVWGPNDGVTDLDAFPDQGNPSEEEWSKMMPIGGLWHNLNTSPQLNAADFSLDVPAGYEIERQVPATVSEEEMLEYLRAACEFNDGQFPDTPTDDFDSDLLNAEWDKPETARSAQAKALIEQLDKFRMREIYESPLKRFVRDQTESDSFHYVGSDIEIGTANEIVCWYRLKRGTGYRAVYGDLQVKNVSQDALPAISP